MQIVSPYLLFLGAVSNPLDAKTGYGLVQWRREECVAQWRLPGCGVDLGLPDLDPKAAFQAGARSMIVGVAPTGGALDPGWIPSLREALAQGLDVVSGMHGRLGDNTELATVARVCRRQLIDVRVPPAHLAVASGEQRSGRRILTIGSDCCVGKKYTALAVHEELRRRGVAATFRATGQTGILIAGGGIPLDAVVSDFLAGAAEALSPAAAADHWDVIEGQGSLFHPAYAAVSLGLLHGSQPDALILCHDPGRSSIDEYPAFPVPDPLQCIEANLAVARLTSPAVRCVGIAINSSALSSLEADRYQRELAERCGIPCVDPLRDGAAQLVDAVLAIAA